MFVFVVVVFFGQIGKKSGRDVSDLHSFYTAKKVPVVVRAFVALTDGNLASSVARISYSQSSLTVNRRQVGKRNCLVW